MPLQVNGDIPVLWQPTVNDLRMDFKTESQATYLIKEALSAE